MTLHHVKKPIFTCSVCGWGANHDNEIPRWDSEGYTITTLNEEDGVRMCHDCAERRFHVHSKTIGGRVSNNRRLRAGHNNQLKAAVAYLAKAHKVWGLLGHGLMTEEEEREAVLSFIEAERLTSKMKSKKRFQGMYDMLYDIAWEYVHHPVYIAFMEEVHQKRMERA